MLRVAFHQADTDDARAACTALEREIQPVDAEDADYIVVLGGDGTMLDALHKYGPLKKPFYGLNRGTVGFLLNPYGDSDLATRLAAAQAVHIKPLRLIARDANGIAYEAMAFNEVSLFRQSRQMAKIRIAIDGAERMAELNADGVLVSTPAGSTAYNLSAHGPIMPLGTDLLALTPISPFRPRHWRGALIKSSARFTFDVLEVQKRPVSITADFREFQGIVSAEIWQDDTASCTLLFDPDHNLEERILREQFTP